MTKKRIIVKIVAVAIVLLLVIGMVGGTVMYIFAADGDAVTEKKTDFTKNIPLLILLVNYDADGDGVNDWDPENPSKLYSDSTQKYYGEQWAGTNPEDIYDTYFGKGNGSLCDYFSEMSLGQFTYTPAEFDTPGEDFTVENGIIEITINAMHPTAYFVKYGEVESATYLIYCSNLISKALYAVDEYINFAKFDKNRDWKVDETELGLLMISAGGDRSTSSPTTYKMETNPKYYFQVHSAAYIAKAVMDKVTITPKTDCNVASIGEFYKKGIPMTIGAAAHELAHTMGAEDLYHTGGSFGGEDSVPAGWPQPYNFSLECDGSHLNGGKSPSYLDPYQRIFIGWTTPQIVENDGEYTLYSTKSGKYNVLLVPAPDKSEYFLIELRMKEGFDAYTTEGSSKGGILIWHIDDDIIREYHDDGYTDTAVKVDGKVHDPGIVPLFRTGWNTAGNRIIDSTPSDPFYYLSEDAGTSVFDSTDFTSATNGTVSLNSYPEEWDEGVAFNLHVEVLDTPGEEMKIKISTSTEIIPPSISGYVASRATHSLSICCSVDKIYGEEITECGVILSAHEIPDEENGRKIVSSPDGDMNYISVFNGLNPNVKYYYIVYATTASGTKYSNVYSASTLPMRSYFIFYMHKNLTSDDRPAEVKGYVGKVLSYSFPMEKQGYIFGGWYFDTELTEPFDLSYTRSDTESDVHLYARWVSEDETTSSKQAETTSTTSLITTVPDSTTSLSTTEEKERSDRLALIAVIVAVALIAVAVVVAFIFIKKKGNEIE